MDDGVHGGVVVDMLMAEGPYSLDTATSIVGAATAFYCSDHLND
jgi:hypothetical protein